MSRTTEIRDRIFTAIKQAVQAVDSTFNPTPLIKSVVNAFSTALAPEFKLLEIFTVNAARQSNPLTADSERESDIGSLESWGKIKLNRDPDSAVAALYEVEIGGSGGTLPAGAQFVNEVTGLVYLNQTETIVGPPAAIINVQSAEAGEIVAMDIGTEITLQITIPGVGNIGYVSGELTSPADAETTEDYRDDVIQAFRIVPAGGNRGDYVLWGDEVAGVRQVYPYSGTLLNEVTVYVQEPLTPSNPQGAAGAGIVSDVEANILLKQPMTAGDLTVQSIVKRGYDIDITNLSDNSVKPTIATVIDSYFAAKQPFIDGVDLPSERADSIINAEVFAVVQNAILPATITNLQLSFSVTPVIFETLPDGNIPYSNSITYL